MKIAQASGWFFPDSLGGTERYVAGLSSRLVAAGHQVTIVAPIHSGKAEQFYEYHGIPVYRFRIPQDLSRAQVQGKQEISGCENLHAWLRRFRPDVVHFHSLLPGLGLAEIQASRDSGARVIATAHTPGLGYVCQRGTMLQWGERLCDGVCHTSKCAACELQHRGLSKTLARALGALPLPLSEAAAPISGRLGTTLGMRALIRHNRWRQRQLSQLVDRFVVLTQWAKDALLANGFPAAKLELNRLGHSLGNVAKKPGPDESPTTRPIRVGYLGRFDPLKGVEDLIRAGRSVSGGGDLRFELYGPSPNDQQSAYYRSLVRHAEGDERFQFHSAVNPDVVARKVAEFDLLVVPSRCTEGGPTVAIEAHAVGTPVVGSSAGGLAEMITDGVNGRLFAPGDISALQGILQHVSENPAGTIDQWRLNLPAPRTMDDIADDYLQAYDAITALGVKLSKSEVRS